MKRFFIAIYCPPQVAHGSLPARNTKAAFSLIKNAGIDNVFGHYEDKSGIDALKLSLESAESVGIQFYPRLKVFKEFVGIDGALNYPSVSYNNLPQKEKSALHSRLEKMLALCAEYSSFGGIFMDDERGYEAFDGIAAAQKHFSALYPDKLFMYNHLNYFIDDHVYFYGAVQIEGEEKKLYGDLSDDAENRFRRYSKFIGDYIKKVDAEYISTDVYPFMPTWKEVPTSIHRSLYEVQSFFAALKERTGLKPLTYVQVGNWDDDSRYIGKTEIALHLGIASAYNFDGFAFFPGCFPNDWLDANEGEEGCGKNGKTGLLDADGNPTVYYEDTKNIIKHFDAMGEHLKNTRWLGVAVTGDFVGGFTEKELAPLKWNECIYRGGLPENETHEYTGRLPIISSSSQLFVGAFESDGEKKLIVINNSIVTDCEVVLDCDTIKGCISNARFADKAPEKITLQAGESILLITK